MEMNLNDVFFYFVNLQINIYSLKMNINLLTFVMLTETVKEILSKFYNPVINKHLPKKSSKFTKTNTFIE